MIRYRHSYVLRLAAILLPALLAGLVSQLPLQAEGRANAAPQGGGNGDGISNTLWNNTFNWTPNGDPTSSELCIIPGGKPHYPFLGAGDIGQCGSIRVDSGGTINVFCSILEASNAII